MFIGDEELNERDFFVIKDKAERLKTKKQLQMNQIIKNAIQINTLKLINQRNKTQDFKESFKPNSLYDNLVDDTNRHLVNQMPFLLVGLVETIFLDEKNGKQKLVYGCGLLIDTNIILVPAKNLVYDDSDDLEEESEEEEQNEENKEKEKNENDNDKEGKNEKEKNNYTFFKIEFQPLNLSPEYRSYFPNSIKVIDHYTPINQNDNIYNSSTSSLKDKEVKTDSNKKEEETVKTDSEKVGNSWGIAFLEYPMGDIINYIYNKTKINPTYSNKYSINRKNNNYNIKENTSIFDKIKIDNLSDDELTKTEFFFLECLLRNNDDISEEENETNANTNNIEQNNNNIENNENNENKNNVPTNENKNDKKNDENKNKEDKNEKGKENNDSKKDKSKKEENKNEENENKNENNNENNNENINENNEENGENTEESSGLSEQQSPTLPYQFFESQYLMNFEQRFIFLKNPYQDQEFGKDLLPGFIVGKYMNRYHILGMNTSTILAFKNSEEENNENNNNENNKNENNQDNNNNEKDKKENIKEEEKNNNKKNNENKDNNNNENNNMNNNMNNNENNNENNEENNLNDSQFIHRAIRFTKELSSVINSKIQELNFQNQREFVFNERIFELFDTNIKNKEFLINLLKNNCAGLYKFLNKLKETKNITNNDKLALNITNDSNLKFIQFCLMIIYNKLSSSIIESKIIDFELFHL